MLLPMLTGCAPTLGLATSGPVEQLSTQSKGSSRVFIDPKGPQDSAKPEEIIRGFLASLPAGPQSDGFSTARQYLTPRTATTWKPDSAVTVYSGEPRIDVQANQFSQNIKGVRVRVTYEQVGRVDNHGVYRANDTTTSGIEEFQCQFEHGQWRINMLSNGVLISDSDFAQSYREVQLYMPDSSLTTMIPDTRWFSWNGWRTAAVQELLRGPVEFLRSSVYRDGFNNNVQLDLDSVTVAGTTAQVKLTNAVASLSKQNRALLVHQLRLTLNDGNNKGPIRVIDDSGADLSNDDNALQMKVIGQTSHLYSLTHEALVTVRNSSSNLLRVGLTPPQLQDLTNESLSSQPFRLVFNSQGGMVIGANAMPTCLNANAQVIDCEAQWSSLSLRGLFAGIRNEIWAITQDNTIAVFTQKHNDPAEEHDNQQGVLQILHPAWSNFGTLISLCVSPEGSRIAVLVQRPQGDYVVLIAGIVRDEQGGVQDVSQYTVTLLRDADIQDIAFFNDTTIVIAQGSLGCIAQATGPCTNISIPMDTRQLVGVQLNNAQSLVSLSNNGVVRYISSSLQGAWRQLDSQTLSICAG